MSDHSAAALMGAMLECGSPPSIAVLTEALAVDPPLVVWGSLLAQHRFTVKLDSLASLAGWLVAHGPESFACDSGDGISDSRWEPADAQRFADQVEFDLQMADLAARMALPDGPPVVEGARFLGLLHGARQWLAMTVSPDDSRPAIATESPMDGHVRGVSDDMPHPAAKELFASWAIAEHLPAVGHVVKAAQLLTGKQSAEAIRADLTACRQRAAAQREHWLERIALTRHLPALAEKLRRLGQLEGQFQETLESEKLEAMAEFAAGAGHEINNPLAVIGGRAQLLLRQETDPERRRELALMNAQVKRAYEMIADMRLFARPPKPEMESLDLVALVDRVVAELTSLAAERVITLSRSGEPGPLTVEADPLQIQVALRALCTNSFEAIGQEGRVEIAIQCAGEDVQILVRDDGPGILPEHRRHIFDPFFSARQAGRGLGLGLSKCWRIVTGHGGRIEVESRAGHGAAFTITLPRRRAAP